MTSPMNLAELAADLHEPVERYAGRLEKLLGAHLRGLTIYGAALAGLSGANQAVQNVLVVDAVDLESLRRLAGEGASFGRWRIAAPLIVTPAYIEASRDTFPLELIEIQQQHVTVLGHDFFAGLEFQAEHIRLECERELKVMLLGMHRGLMSSQGREDRLGALGADIGQSLVRVLRGLLWLKGDRQGRPAFHVIAAVEKLVQRELLGVYAALDTADAAGWHKFCRLYADLQALGQFADAF